MRLSGLLHLYRVRLRARGMQELLVVVGIGVGVALMFAALVANTSLTSSVRGVTRGLVGHSRFQVSSPGPEGIDQRLTGVISRIDGVAGLSTLLLRSANAVGPAGQRSVALVSGDARWTRFGGEIVRRFTAQIGPNQAARGRALAIPALLAAALGVAVGDVVQLQIAHRTFQIRTGILLQRSDYGTAVDSPLVLTSLRFAQRISDMRGRLSRIFVVPEPGRSADVRTALRKAAPRANVVNASFEATAFERAAYPMVRSSSVFSAFAALIGFLFAFSAVLLTVPQRRRFIADLRMAGHEPWVVLELLLFDALALGVAGSLLGLFAGYLAVRHLLEIVPSILTCAFPVGEHLSVTWENVALAVAAGLAAACFAVLVPLRDLLSRRRVGAEAGRDGFGPSVGAVALGVATFALSVGLVAFAPQAGPVSFSALAATVMLFVPTFLRASTTAFEALTAPLRTPVPTLAALELRSRSTRTRAVALASTAAIAVMATVSLDGSQRDLQRGLEAAATTADSNGDVWATFPGTANGLSTTPFPVPARAIAAVRALPGVSRVSIYRGSFLDIGSHRTWVQAPPRSARVPIGPAELHRGDPAVTTRRLRAHGWVVLSQAIADVLGAGVGDRVTLPTPVPTRMRVAAISTNLGWPAGAVVLNADDYARAWGSSTPAALQIEVDAGTSASRVAAEVRRALPATLPALIETRAARLARHYAASRDSLARIDQVSALVLLSAVLAMVGAMAGMIWQRRPAIARLKVHGYPEGELWRALLLESTLLLGTGSVLGAAFGLYGQILFTRCLQAMTDLPAGYATAGLTALSLLLLVTVVAVAMVAVPGWLAVRVRPAPGGAA